MTDARLKGEWHGMLRYEQLSDAGWRVFTNALMWSAQNGTDGRIPFPYPFKLHPFGGKQQTFDELTEAGLWKPDGDSGYQLTGWSDDLGQSTAAEVEAYKENARKRQRRHRERERAKLENTNKRHVTRDVMRDVGRDVGEGEGEGEGEQDRDSNDESENATGGRVTFSEGGIVADEGTGEVVGSYVWRTVETADGRRRRVKVPA